MSGAEGGIQDITVLGDNVNVAARLSQAAGPGEALISEAVFQASGESAVALEARQVSDNAEQMCQLLRERLDPTPGATA